jgi:hypothetical protein
MILNAEVWFLLTRWDNSEREKMSPWDMEPISDEG